ncbi:DnaJ domain-containing protein [Methylomagnum sp.]
MIQLLLLLGVVFFAMLAARRYLRTAPADAAKKFRRVLLGGGLLLALLLAASGRLAFLLPLIGAFVVSLIRFLPMLLPLLIRAIPIWQQQQRQRSARPHPAGGGADTSTVASRFLRMRLDHVSGEIGGEVLAGRYAGRQLAELDRAQLTDLYNECVRGDQEAATLLRAYLERVYGEAWEDAGPNEAPPPSNGKMTADEAYEVLGLERGASRDDIVGAHRRLMQRLHPDRGGSDYLAAKINQAKDVLLGR